MASVPSKGDRLTAKVQLTAYIDEQCSKEYPPVLPGPSGLRKSVQFPATRATKEEVGVYTGLSSEKGYQAEMVLKYQVAKQNLIGWTYLDVVKFAVVWVKKDQVTGFWDKGVDSPVNDPDSQTSPPPPTEKDNTNTYLLAAVGFGLIMKFVLPKLKK